VQAQDLATPPNVRVILFKLAHRIVTSVWKPTELNADRLYVYITILRALELWDDARALLESEQGKSICSRNLTCDEIRRDIWRINGWLTEEAHIAEQRIVEQAFVSFRALQYVAKPFLP